MYTPNFETLKPMNVIHFDACVYNWHCSLLTQKENRELTAAVDSFSGDKNFLLQKVVRYEKELADAARETAALANQVKCKLDM